MSNRPNNQPPHAAWLVLPEVQEAIETTLRQRGIRDVDVDDERQSVLIAGLRVRVPPVSLAQCKVLVRKIAIDRATDYHRKKTRHAKRNLGLVDNADDHAKPGSGVANERHPIDARRQLHVVARAIEKGDVTARQAEILDQALDDVAHAETAAKLDLKPQTVANELVMVRKTLRAEWAKYGSAAMFAALLVFVGIMLGRGNEAAAPPAEEEILEHGEELRAIALRACDEARWKACLEGLNEAARFDPRGDLDDSVIEARSAAAEHVGGAK